MTSDVATVVRNLFRQEVPEVADGTIELKKVARKPGVLTKVAVVSHDADVDPIGSCVGVRGVRMKSIVSGLNEAHGIREKVDLFRWFDSLERLVVSALSPAKVVSVTLDSLHSQATVVVTSETFDRAIGEEGINQNLIEELCSCRLTIVSSETDPDQSP